MKSPITEEQIVQAAVDVVRDGGGAALSARAIARRLGCSTMPVYSTAGSMDRLRALTAGDASRRMTAAQSVPRTGNPPLDMAVGYIVFAREEPRLFRFLIETARPLDTVGVDGNEAVRGVLDFLADAASRGDFLLRSWIFTHGLAELLAAGAVTMDDEEIVRHLSAAGGAFLRAERHGPEGGKN